jgi:hypothetical protein
MGPRANTNPSPSDNVPAMWEMRARVPASAAPAAAEIPQMMTKIERLRRMSGHSGPIRQYMALEEVLKRIIRSPQPVHVGVLLFVSSA